MLTSTVALGSVVPVMTIAAAASVALIMSSPATVSTFIVGWVKSALKLLVPTPTFPTLSVVVTVMGTCEPSASICCKSAAGTEMLQPPVPSNVAS
ncbi:hypothetical protein D3C81_1950910 [compost metagenome]